MANIRVRWNGDRVTEDVKMAVGRGLFKGASHILNEANNIAPLDEGPLTQTAGVDVDVDSGKASVYYVQKYGPRLHENPQYNFQRGRQGKWLETTIMNPGTRARTQQAIAEEIRRTLGG